VNLLWKDRVPCKIKLNAISNIPFLAKILLPILAIVTIWLLSGENNSDNNRHASEINRASDYAMTDFTMTVMDNSGNPSRVITGSEMAHYPEDDSTEIISPLAHFIEPGKDTWIISSNKGESQGKGENILLTGNVIITRKDNAEIELYTEKLNIDTVNNTAYTDSAATIKSPQGETNTVGLHAALEDKTINLHSKVRGHYDAPPTQ